MKKLIALFMLAALALSLSACGQSSTAPDPAEEPASAQHEHGEWNQYSSYYGAVEVTAPKDAYNFLTGENNLASDCTGRRPFAVAVNNINVCWPQCGLSRADIVYEMEAEGGITRILALYADVREVELIGPIRSLRDQLLDASCQFDPIVTHIGTSIFVEKTIVERDFRTLDGVYIPHSVYKDKERNKEYAVESCWFSSPLLIYESLPAAKLKLEADTPLQSAFSFVSGGEGARLSGGEAQKVAFKFSDYANGDFRYDEASERYLKWQFGERQLDAGNGGAQLAFDNVFILFAKVDRFDEGAYIKVFDYAAGGEGLYLSRGRYERITWNKPSFEENFAFTAADGAPLEVNSGNSYIAIASDERADTLQVEGRTF